VELVLQEIFSTVADQAKQGNQIRLNFKCGWLVFKQNLIKWQHSRELYLKHKLSLDCGDQLSIPPTVVDSQQVSV
jgi:hypothetical protein